MSMAELKITEQTSHQGMRADLKGFTLLAERLRGLTGVDLVASEKNLTLMACRLGPLMRRLGTSTYTEYDRVLRGGEGGVVREFISIMTTHTTDFYRESQHFDLFGKLIEPLLKAKRTQRNPELRVWCAAASSGQEAYSMLFQLLEACPTLVHWTVPFLASDIDRGLLLKAAAGKYTEQEMAKVPQGVREKYFDRKAAGQTGATVRSQYRKKITFAEFNLAIPKYPFQHAFDIVFCRNVLIYFSQADGVAVVDRLAENIAPGGYLFLGHAEMGFVKTKLLKAVAPAVFQKQVL